MQEWVRGQWAAAASGQDPGWGLREVGQGFDFLGYRFEPGQHRVRRKSMVALRERIGPRPGAVAGTVCCIIADLNPLLKGWFGYFFCGAIVAGHPFHCRRLP